MFDSSLAIMVACINFTALRTSFVAAYICDLLCQRMSVIIDMCIYIIWAMNPLSASKIAALIVGRMRQGVGPVMLSITVTIRLLLRTCHVSFGLLFPLTASAFNISQMICSPAWVGYTYAFHQVMSLNISEGGLYTLRTVLIVALIS